MRRELNVEIVGDKVRCKNIEALVALVGTTSVKGNYHMFHVNYEKGVWEIPLEVVYERRKILKERAAKDLKKLATIVKFLDEMDAYEKN